MEKRNLSWRRCAAAPVLALLVFVLALALFPRPVYALEPEIRSVDISVELAEDGSAQFTEVWDVTTASGTEFYIPKYNMDGRVISDFTVTDETGAVFTDVGEWDSDLDREEKAGKSGLIETNGGYELCWGFGSYGEHTYTLRYNMTGLVRSYEEADGIYQALLPKDLFAPVQRLSVTIAYPGTVMTTDDTLVWAFGYSVNFGLEDGQLRFESEQPLSTDEYCTVLVRFEKGMFTPDQSEDRSFEDVKAEAMEGSSYPAEQRESIGERIFQFIGPLIAAVVGLSFVFAGRRASGSRSRRRALQKQYKDVEYSRKLPYNGSVPATYARLDELGQLENEGVVIGAYILRWVRSGQVEISAAQTWTGKEEQALLLRPARSGMQPTERSLYDMMVAAAGADSILQSKEFKKWSNKNHERVGAWFEAYKNGGHYAIRQMGGVEDQPVKHFFCLLSSTQKVATPLGEQLTLEMFGFKKYLEDFTIINERQAREVQLWDDYLVFAQVFGIAEAVAEQFKKLYPDYFRQVAAELGANVDYFDIWLITRMAGSYSRAMTTGWHAGNSASLSEGFGGSYSGGGGFSGGGFSSGGGTR